MLNICFSSYSWTAPRILEVNKSIALHRATKNGTLFSSRPRYSSASDFKGVGWCNKYWIFGKKCLFPDFISYIERNYVTGGQTSSPRFPPIQWSCAARTLNSVHRTTNTVERWHRNLDSVIHKFNGLSPLKLSHLVEKLKKEENHTKLDAEELSLDPNFKVNHSNTSFQTRFNDINVFRWQNRDESATCWKMRKNWKQSKINQFKENRRWKIFNCSTHFWMLIYNW